MEKVLYNDNLKTIYTSKKKVPFFIDVPDMNYIVYSGNGHPNGEDFQDSCNALFTLSYIIKFKIAKAVLEKDYKVNPLEVNWYLSKSGKNIDFTWDAMIMQPSFITMEMYEKAIELAKADKKDLKYEKLQFKNIHFGKCVQCFHSGDYNLMNDTMHKMFDFAEKQNYDHDLYTHDIYLNDSRKTKTENLKSIMRICVREK